MKRPLGTQVRGKGLGCAKWIDEGSNTEVIGDEIHMGQSRLAPGVNQSFGYSTTRIPGWRSWMEKIVRTVGCGELMSMDCSMRTEIPPRVSESIAVAKGLAPLAAI